MDELWRQWPKDQRILVSNKGRTGHHYPVEIVETGEQFDSQIECAKALHSTKSNISKAVLGKVKKHKGFTIRRVEKS